MEPESRPSNREACRVRVNEHLSMVAGEIERVQRVARLDLSCFRQKLITIKDS